MITLTLDAIPDTVAAHLASTLVGHVLWANAQIPLPIPQLAKMQNGTNKKLVRMRAELLDSYDTLISHLATTFTALATAFAKSRPGLSKAELAIIIGPSPTTARSRVLLVLDGLETRVWGAREDEGDESEGDDEEESEGDEDEEADAPAEEPPSDDDDDASDPDPDDDDESPPDSDNDSEDEETTQELARQTLRTADRLFSRALVDAECAGHGLTPPGKPPSPSQTHILLRAPRDFVHPAWIPKQNFVLKDKGMGKVVRVRAGEGAVRDEEEEDLIWWVWDGKIVGFDGW